MKRLFSNTVFSSLDAFVLVALNLLATPILIRHFGVSEYGVFVFLSIFSTYGMLSFFDLGMEGSLLNYVARFEAAGDRDSIQDSLTISLIYYGAIGLALGVVLYGCAGFITGRFIDNTGTLDQATLLRAAYIVSINVVVQFLTLPFTAVLQGLRRFVITKAANTILLSAQYLALIVIAVKYNRIDLGFGVILAVTATRLLTLALITRYGLSYFRPMRFRLRFGLLRTLFSYSSILLVSRIIGIIFNQMDKFLIWLFLAVSQMTIYDVVVRPANLIRLLITTVNSAIIPEVARMHANHETDRIRRLYIDLVRYVYLIMLPILAVFYAHMQDILTLWVGAEIARHSSLALIILSVYLLSPMAAVASTMAVGLEIVKKVLWISIVASVMNICLSLLLLQRIGLAGLLIATLAAELFMVYPYLRSMQKIVKMKAREVFRPTVVIALTALPFVAANLAVHASYSGRVLVWVSAAILLTVLHYLANFRLLLRPDERLFLLGKLGLGRRGETQ